MKTKLWSLAAGGLMAAGVTLGGADPAEAQDYTWPDYFTVVTPNVGTANHSLAVAWTSEFSAQTDGRARVLPGPNGYSRSQWLASGEGTISLIQASDYFDQMDGVEGYALDVGGPEDTRLAMMNLVTGWSFIVRGDNDLQQITDVGPGTRIAFASSSSFLMTGVDALLAYNGLSRDDVELVEVGNYGANTKIVAEGRADVAFTSPISGTSYEAEANPNGIRWLALPEESADPDAYARYRALMPGYVPGEMSAGVESGVGVYMDHAYQANHVKADTDPEFVYQLAKWLDEHHADFSDDYIHASMMSLDSLVGFLEAGHLQPLHEGVIRLLQEKGLWKDAYQVRQDALVDLAQSREALFAEALAEAEAKGLKATPDNAEWVALWEAKRDAASGGKTYGELVLALPKG